MHVNELRKEKKRKRKTTLLSVTKEMSLLLLGDLCAAAPRHASQPRCLLRGVWGRVLLPFQAHQGLGLAIVPLLHNIAD